MIHSVVVIGVDTSGRDPGEEGLLGSPEQPFKKINEINTRIEEPSFRRVVCSFIVFSKKLIYVSQFVLGS